MTDAPNPFAARPVGDVSPPAAPAPEADPQPAAADLGPADLGPADLGPASVEAEAEAEVEAEVGDPQPAVTATGSDGSDMALLDQLEADLVAVDTAIETIERIAAEGSGGEHAAAEILAAVSEERFGTT